MSEVKELVHDIDIVQHSKVENEAFYLELVLCFVRTLQQAQDGNVSMREDRPVIVAGPICTTSEYWINCTCTSKANPPANTTWEANGRMMSGNGSNGEADTWDQRNSHLHLSLTQDHPIQTGDVITCIAANEHGNSISKYQLHSDGGTSGTNILMIGGIAAGLSVFIAIAAIIMLRMKKLKESTLDTKTNDNFIIYSSLQLSTNTENDSRTLGQQLAQTTENEPIVYAAIRV
ncbi:sialic acid-binding Ig-like lectin 11 [Stegostoma tigrinum]|uniref:sialic acid-binding Ig-like lectin 11 n=1 Tax=Stegostoma tigrinum TaxID=3053191 RepID=UPI0028706E93|nr:sialic acid-binding Ig-like lectin 11 [Stegostoma tigrinum]